MDALHGLKHTDEEVLTLFRRLGVPHQIILSKVDRVLFPKMGNMSVGKVRAKIEQNGPVLAEIVEDLRKRIQPGLGDGPEALGEVIACSTDKVLSKKKFGVDDVRWATLVATGLENKKRWLVDSMIQPSTGLHQSERIVSEDDLVVQEQL